MSEVASLDVARKIRSRILKGQLKAGDTLTALTLARDLSVSRIPVRDALRDLQREGLVTITPRQQANVRELSVAEITDLFILRFAVEPFISLLAASRRLPADLRHLGKIVAEMKKVLTRMNDGGVTKPLGARMEKWDADFHQAIVVASHSPVAEELFQKLQVWRILSPGTLPNHLAVPPGYHGTYATALAQHEELFRAIESGKAERARTLMAKHLQAAYEAAIAWVQPNTLPHPL